MELAIPTWILVVILSIVLLVFLILGIILLAKLISMTKEVRKIIITGQGIAEKADDIADNVKDMSSVGGLVKHFVDMYTKKGKK